MRLDDGHLISAECRGFAQERINLSNWINCGASTNTATTTIVCFALLLAELLMFVGCRLLLLLFWFMILIRSRRDGLVSEGVDPHFLQFLLDVSVPVVLDLVVSSPREVSCNLRPPAKRRTETMRMGFDSN